MGWTLLIALLLLAVLVMLVPDLDVKIKRFKSDETPAPKHPKLLDRYKILKRENK